MVDSLYVPDLSQTEMSFSFNWFFSDSSVERGFRLEYFPVKDPQKSKSEKYFCYKAQKVQFEYLQMKNSKVVDEIKISLTEGALSEMLVKEPKPQKTFCRLGQSLQYKILVWNGRDLLAMVMLG